MIKSKPISINFVILLFGILIYLFHFLERDPSSPYERPIISDAKGYYAYLPAIFIYKDLQYDFLEEMDAAYYSVGQDKHIFIEQNGKRINKTFPGVALLYLPFFLIAHFLASILNLPADGYSDIYQYLFDFGQFFYATLGMIFMAKTLVQLEFKRQHILVSVGVLMLGTNLWYYTVYDQSVTHVYNFFLINLLIYGFFMFKAQQKLRDFILVASAFSLLLIIRPTSFMTLLLIGFIFPEKSFWKLVLSQFLNWKGLLVTIAVIIAILSIPLLLWKVQSGNWIVYSYGEEGFDFAHPEIFKFLFSYAKGWWLYSPLILVAILLGGVILFKSSKKGRLQTYFLLVFLILSIYIFSSWWCWWYGFSFGQRPMVDYYFFVGFLLAVILKKINGKRWQELTFGSVAILAIMLNLLQSYQQHHGFFQWSKPNAEIYWDNFLRFNKQAKVYSEDNWQLLESSSFDFETAHSSYYGEIIQFEGTKSGEHVITVDENKPFSCNLMLVPSTKNVSDFIVFSFGVMPLSDLSKTDFVVEYRGDESTYRSYNFNEFVEISQWSTIEVKYDVPAAGDTLVIYFWNKDSEQKAYFDDVKVDYYRLK